MGLNFPGLPLILLLLMSCAQPVQNAIDIQGHRGARGLMPENTIPAFIHAVEIGVNTLEIDVVITRDKKVLVSHEPYISPIICLDNEGKEIPENKGKDYNIYQMTYEQVSKFDCGSKSHPGFSGQKKLKINKPLLSEVIDTVERHLKVNNASPVEYNIEIKSTSQGDGVFHPPPEEFVKLVLDLLEEKGMKERTIIQSFDIRALQAAKSLVPGVKLALLVGNSEGPRANIQALEFIPDIYSPEYTLVDKSLILYAEKLNMKVVPWTVNNTSKMKQMIKLGVDGIITDYPDRAMQVVNKNDELK